MSIGNLILGINSVTVSYLIRYDSLSQNARYIITKCKCYFITKYYRSLFTKCVKFFITKCDSLLQNATVITNCDDFITKCDSYDKIRRLLQIATVHYIF